MLAAIYDAIELLLQFPTIGHFRPEITDKNLRFYRVKSFWLIYDPESEPLDIAYIYHAAQDVQSLLDDREK